MREVAWCAYSEHSTQCMACGKPTISGGLSFYNYLADECSPEGYEHSLLVRARSGSQLFFKMYPVNEKTASFSTLGSVFIYIKYLFLNLQ